MSILDIVTTIVAVVYFSAAFGLLLYGVNSYIAIVLFSIRQKSAATSRSDLREEIGDLFEREDAPVVTTQLPIYNEYNVIVRAMEAACAMRYPAGRHQIQVLDDSTDETVELVDQAAARLRDEGHDIEIVRREERVGFKAGALRYATDLARGDLLAVFDADFVPPEDYLLKTVPFFLDDPKVGLVQSRWGHLNANRSLLTRVQSVGIDGHFMVEQAARAWNGLFMNFNGTAGIWRREAIADGGGWQWDTLTEDMDLSYRSQLAGWKARYLPDVVVPAEIPEDVQAFKIQQFRWAKGSIQTAKKILPLLLRSKVPPFKLYQAFFHLTHYMVHPLMLTLAVLALPVLLSLQLSLGVAAYVTLGTALLLATAAPTSLYIVSQRAAYADWKRRLVFLPLLVVVGVGLAVSNTRAVFEAIIGRESPFVRTPKRGEHETKRYRVPIPASAFVEVLVGLYCVLSFFIYIYVGKYLVGPFLGMYAAGFLFIGLLSIARAFGFSDRKKTQEP